MTEQPVEGLYTPEQRRDVKHHAYRLVTALVTARDDAATRHKLINLAIEEMPQGNNIEMGMLMSMLASSVSMLTEYVRATADAFDELTHPGAFQEQHAASIRTELLED